MIVANEDSDERLTEMGWKFQQTSLGGSSRRSAEFAIVLSGGRCYASSPPVTREVALALLKAVALLHPVYPMFVSIFQPSN